MKIKALLLACVLLINPVWASTMEDDEDNKHIVSMEFTKHPELMDNLVENCWETQIY